MLLEIFSYNEEDDEDMKKREWMSEWIPEENPMNYKIVVAVAVDETKSPVYIDKFSHITIESYNMLDAFESCVLLSNIKTNGWWFYEDDGNKRISNILMQQQMHMLDDKKKKYHYTTNNFLPRFWD